VRDFRGWERRFGTVPVLTPRRQEAWLD
jgi:hypothetical protein